MSVAHTARGARGTGAEQGEGRFRGPHTGDTHQMESGDAESSAECTTSYSQIMTVVAGGSAGPWMPPTPTDRQTHRMIRNADGGGSGRLCWPDAYLDQQHASTAGRQHLLLTMMVSISLILENSIIKAVRTPEWVRSDMALPE